MDANPARRSTSRPGLLVALIAFLHGLVYVVLLAPWMGEDEPWHTQYAMMISRGHWTDSPYEFGIDEVRSAPYSHLVQKRAGLGDDLAEIAEVEDAILASMRETGVWRRVDWLGRDDRIESFDEIQRNITATDEPRVFYSMAAPFLWLVPSGSPLASMYVLRGLCLLLFVGTVALSYQAARRAFPQGPGALLVGLAMALWPMSARGGATVNNDVMVRFFVALALYVAARWIARGPADEPRIDDGELRSGIGLPFALVVASAAAVFTKTTGVCAIALALLAVILHPAATRRIGRTALMFGGLAAAVGGAVFVSMAQFNPAVTLEWSENLKRLSQGVSQASVDQLLSTFAGRYNWESRIPNPDLGSAWGWVFAVLCGLGLVALLRKADWLDRRLLILATGTLVAQLGAIALRGTAKGRYLMPAAPALMIVAVAGLLVVLPRRSRRAAVFVATCALILFSGFYSLTGLARENWVVWRW